MQVCNVDIWFSKVLPLVHDTHGACVFRETLGSWKEVESRGTTTPSLRMLTSRFFCIRRNPASMGMCSKCYREHASISAKQVEVQQQAQAVAEAAAHVFPTPAPGTDFF